MANGTVIGLWLLAARTPAALRVYEGFDYPPATSIESQNGGMGWTEAWAAGSGPRLATNVTGSLTYTDPQGRTLQSSGGSLLVGNPTGSTATTATPSRTLPANLSGGAGTTAGPGATRWISLLYQRLNIVPAPYLRQANLGLFEGSGERVAVGGPNTSLTVSNVLSVWGSSGTHNGSAPFQSAPYPITGGSTFLLLLKVVTDGSADPDTAYVWFNWTNLLVEPDIALADVVQNEMNLSSVNTLRLQAGNANASGSNAVFLADEVRVGDTFADVTPNVASLGEPTIITQPADQTVTTGDPASFSVSAGGLPPLHYQWYFLTNVLLADQTNATLTLTSARTNDAGVYHVVITNTAGAVTSSVATLTVLPPAPPAITLQPVSRTVIAGESATFSVGATGQSPLSYQWLFNTHTYLAGETNATLALPPTQPADAGGYSVVISNPQGAVTSSVATLTVIDVGPAGLPAFPGADGAAAFITGGRGGLVYHVTRLDRNNTDTRPGTLRYGLDDAHFPAGMPRTIVFDVGGVFWLGRYGAESNHDNGWDNTSRYTLPGRITLAGQTAPGPVIIMGGVTKAGGENIIVRNVTFAPGYGMHGFHEPPAAPAPGDFPDSYVYDALDVSGRNILLDHLTTLYATDETVSCNELADHVTLQYCHIAQGQNYPQADAENPGVYTGHALGSLLQAGSNARISVVHNLYAHLKGRLPRVGSEVGTGALNDFRNNVFYNWFSMAGTGASGQPSGNNFINNFYLAGPGGDDVSGPNITTNNGGGTGIFDGKSPLTSAFVSGNVKDINKDGDALDPLPADGSFIGITPQSAAYNLNLGVTLTAPAAFTNVLRHAGARWWARPYDFTLQNTNAITTNDIAVYVDERLVHETATGNGRIMAWADDPFNPDPAEGWEWRSLLALRADPLTDAAPFTRPAGWDTDGDGMPDAWEVAHGLSPDTANHNADFDSDGYTDLEEYLNEVAAWPAPGTIAFTGEKNGRYAEIFNWRVTGEPVNVAGLGPRPTASLWQPGQFDHAVISNRSVVVDAVGQRAGTLHLAAAANLSITGGWLQVADTLAVGPDASAQVGDVARLDIASNLVNQGTVRLTGSAALNLGGSFTNLGTLDVITWSGQLPPGLVNHGLLLDRSCIRVISAGVSGDDFQAVLQGYAGHRYQLEYRDAAAGSAWQTAGPPADGTGGMINLTHPGGVVAHPRFYRVAVSP